MNMKYIPKLKEQEVKNKYNEKIVKLVSEKPFDEKIIIKNISQLLKNNKNEFINDFENGETKQQNTFLKIKDLLKDCPLSLCVNFKKNKEGKLKLCIRIKENIDEEKEKTIALLQKELAFDVFKEIF